MALMICSECGGQVSDKAPMCVHCGCPREFFTTTPTNSTPKVENVVKVANTKPKRRHMKMPNGYGHIKHLTGNRRKPWAAYPPRRKTDYDDYGKELPIKAIGYFKTRTQAETALMEYRAMRNDNGTVGFTFAKVYEMWMKDYETKNKSQQAISSYSTAYKNVKSLHNMVITSIYKDELQQALDSCELSFSSLNNIKKLYNQIFKYCMANNIIQTNYAQFVEIKKENDIVKGENMTEKEIEIYWKHKDNGVFKIALILIYSGLRISELKVVEIDLGNKVFKGGLKTRESKDRIVPIHSAIYNFVEEFNQKQFNVKNYREKLYEELEALNLLYTENGNKRTPHDFRHTFSWLADKYKLDNLSKHMLMGHKKGNDIEADTYGHRNIEQLREEIEKILVPNL